MSGTPNAGGAWTQLTGAARTITGNNVDFVGASVGAYDFEYRVTGTAPCVDATAVVTVNVVAAPNAGGNNTVSACNNNGAFNLFANLSGTPDAGGTWTQLTGAARTITGNDVDLNGAAAGPYDFEYRVTGTAPCADATAVVTVNVVAAPNAGANNTVSACNNNGAFNLFASLSGTPNAGGTWTQLTGAARTITGNNVDFVGAAVGAYDFEYRVTGTAPCVDATAVVTVNVVAAPNAGGNNTASACNNNGAFNLFANLTGTPDAGGTWTQLTGAARTITGNDVDLNGAAAGSYDFEYRVTGAAPCADATAVVTVNVVAAPNAGANNTVSACNNNGTFNLFTSLSGTPNAGGAWTQLTGAARTITGNNVDFVGAAVGAYDFEYRVMGTAPCADATAVVTVNVTNPPNPGLANTVNTCNSNPAFDLFASLAGTPDAGGSWTELTAGGAVITGNNADFRGIAGGSYQFQYTITSAGCNPVSAIVTVDLFEIATATIAGSTTICAGQNATLTLTLTGVGPWNIQYSDGGAPISINGIASSPHTFQVTPAINTTYSLVSVVDTRCGAGSVSGSATVNVSPIAGNPATFGSETWLAYVYDDSGSPAPPATNIDYANAKYRGFLTETEIGTLSGFSSYNLATDAFSLNLSNTVPVSGPNICGSYLDDSSIRFRMTKTFAAGIYTFSVGADDGVRMFVNGSANILTSPAAPASFSTHAFTTYTSSPICLTAGTHNLVIEYFERAGFSRIDFNYTASPGPTAASPVSLCVNSPAPTLSASLAGALNYNWYTDAALTNPPIFVGANYTPAPAQLDMSTVGTTDFFVTAVYACGETPATQVTVDVTNGASITLPPPPVQICETSASVDLTTLVSATPLGGTFTFSGTGITASPNFDPAGLGGTTSTITVDYTSGTCMASTTFDIDIVNNATITVPPTTTACESSGIVDLNTLVSANPTGGTFTFGGTGVTGNNFDPSGLSGSITITVDYSAGGCVAPQQTFNFNVVPNLSLTSDNSTVVCPAGGAVNLLPLVSANQSGGAFTFSGTGVVGSSFDPSLSGGSTVTINVTYNLGGCMAATTVSVAVRTAIDPLCGGPPPTSNCATVIITPTSTAATCTTSDGSITFNINPTVPTLNNTGVIISIAGASATNAAVARTNVNDPVFPALPFGIYNYTIQYGDPSCIKTGQVSVDKGGTVGNPVASEITPATCSGIPGSFRLNVPGEEGNLLEWSLDAINWMPFTSDTKITGLPSGLSPTFEVQVNVRRNATDLCNASIIIVVNGPQLLDFELSNNNAVCFEAQGGVTLANIRGMAALDYGYEILRQGSIISNGTGTISAAAALSNVQIAGIPSGDYQIRITQDQSATTPCTTPVQSALKPFTVTSPGAALDTLYVTRKISVPDLPTGSMIVGIMESLQEPYEVRLELTQPLIPGQVFARDFVEATRNPLNLKMEYTASNLFAGQYLLSVRDGLGCRKDYVLSIAVDTNLMIPNIFTPNGDGVNEVFFIRNMPDATEVIVSNRWGKQVYSSSNYQNDWGGGDVADGVYYYRIKAGGQTYSGWVEVLRGQ